MLTIGSPEEVNAAIQYKKNYGRYPYQTSTNQQGFRQRPTYNWSLPQRREQRPKDNRFQPFAPRTNQEARKDVPQGAPKPSLEEMLRLCTQTTQSAIEELRKNIR